MKLIFVKVLPILLLVLVGSEGAVVLTQPSDDVYAAIPRFPHDATDLTKESIELKSEIGATKETTEPEMKSIVNTTLYQMPESTVKLSESARNIPKLYSSCVEALQSGGDSGIYKLQLPFSGLEPFDVYCQKDPENGPAWTVVQRRQDGSVNFYRTWLEYKLGFGNLNGEFFLGLRYLYALTNQLKPQQLWIQLADWEGATKTAKYNSFKIGPESTKYTMTQLGAYSGNAGDSLKYHLGSKFSTKDSNNDASSVHCAEKYKGAWWFKSCIYSHLNGEYISGEFSSSIVGIGVNWYHFRGNYYSNKYAHMALRPSH